VIARRGHLFEQHGQDYPVKKRQQLSLPIEQRNLRAEGREDRGVFAANRSGADDAQRFRDAFSF